MTVQELKPGDQFKLNGQRRFRTLTRSIDLDSKNLSNYIQKPGHILLIYDGCYQLVLEKAVPVKEKR